MRHGRRASARWTRWTSALLALVSLAPAGLLGPAPSPCEAGAARVADAVAASAARAARRAGGCGGCCETAPASAPTSVSCGCCTSEPRQEPARLPAPVADLPAATTLVVFVAPPFERPAEVIAPRREAAPPARLLHCVHLI